MQASMYARTITQVIVGFVTMSTTSSLSVGQQDDSANPDPMSQSLVTDRPDFTESTEAIPSGHFQLEAGYTFTYDKEHGERSRDHTAPELLLRIGLFENFELRIGWNGYSYTDTQSRATTRGGRRITVDDWSRGANDMSLGFKYKFREQVGAWPHFGVIGEISVPSGSAGVSSGDVDPNVVLLWAYDVNESLAIAGNVGFGSVTEFKDRFFQASASLSAAFAVSDKIGAYIEYYGLYPNADDMDCAHVLNGGLTYLISNDFQVDWRIGAGLNEEADDFFTGVGFAWRF